LLVFAFAFAVRFQGELPPFDDAYHLKRFQSLPAVFDPDRGLNGAFCPWPPLYDLFGAMVLRVFGSVALLPPIFFALFAACVTAVLLPLRVVAALTTGLTLALSPYLIGISRRWHVDHHFVEPLLLLLIIAATVKRRGVLLGICIAAALLVQPALLIGAGVAFALLFFSDRREEGAKAFAIAAGIVVLYRFAQPSGYPDNAWFLGYSHALALAGAAAACALRRWTSAPLALAAGASIAATSPPLLPGAEWLERIVEFEPMFRDPARIGTDLANLTGGAVLSLALFRRHRDFAVFTLIYLLLALSSRRFLVVAIPLLAIGGALFIATARRRLTAVAAAAAVLLPPLVYDIATINQPKSSHVQVKRLAESIRILPPGRVLAPWSLGHAINVLGQHPVVIDNFGPAPDPDLFRSAMFALDQPEKFLLTWCRLHGVRYVAGRARTPPRSRSD
jgi:hypothetical protein